MKKRIKLLVNIFLSAVLALLILTSLICATFNDFVIDSDLLFAKMEENEAYKEKHEFICEEIQTLLLNSGVSEGFIETVYPSYDLVKESYENSLLKLFSKQENQVDLSSYKETVISAFKAESIAQGITEEEDIAEITQIYWDDIEGIFKGATGFIGAGTIGAYISSLVSAIDKVLIPIIICAVIVYAFMIYLNAKKNFLFTAVPFAVTNIFIFLVYLLLSGYAKGGNFDSIQMSFINLGCEYLIYILQIGILLLATALLVVFVKIIINKIMRGKKVGKE